MPEVTRLYSVLDKQLAGRDYVCDDYSIADMAIWPWAQSWQGQEQDISGMPNLAAWLDRCGARAAVIKGKAVAEDLRGGTMDKEAQKHLFKAR